PSTGTGCAPERGQAVPHSSGAPARSPRGVARGETAVASPASPGDAAASQAPSPTPTPDPQGGRDGEGLDPASRGNAVPPLAGQDFRAAWKAANSKLAKAQRNQRGQPRRTAGRQPGYGAGGNRRMPGKPAGGDVAL